jgi:hypothetical protein
MLNKVISEIVAEQASRKRHAMTLAYLAGYITKAELNESLWRISVGLPA